MQAELTFDSGTRSIHWLDHAVRLLSRRRLFTAGWGDEEVLAQVPTVARFDMPCSAAEITWGPSRREGRVDATSGVSTRWGYSVPLLVTVCCLQGAQPEIESMH